MVGRTYLERGRPVVVVARWLGQGTPRNVLIRRDDGELVVRPFRGPQEGARTWVRTRDLPRVKRALYR